MNKFHSFALGGALALGLIGMAHADSAVTGAWKVSVGAADAPCTLTLTAYDASPNAGDVANSGNCTNGAASVGHWKAVGSNLQLLSGGSELIASLKPKGDTYEGKRIADGRTVVLAR